MFRQMPAAVVMGTIMIPCAFPAVSDPGAAYQSAADHSAADSNWMVSSNRTSGGYTLEVQANEDCYRFYRGGTQDSEGVPSWIELRDLQCQTAAALAEITGLYRRKDFELAILYDKQKAAANHLDGNIWLDDIAREIQELTKKYDSRIARADQRFERLLDELDTLKDEIGSTDEQQDKIGLRNRPDSELRQP